MLQVPADSGLRGFRLGLHHRAQEVRGQLLFRRVSTGVPAEISAHTPRAAHQQNGRVPGYRSMLRAPKNVSHFHVVLRRRHEHRLRSAARHGGR